MNVRAIGTGLALAAGIGLTAGVAGSADYAPGYGKAATAPAAAATPASAGDACGSVAVEFGLTGGRFGVGGLSDDTPWLLADRPTDDGVTAFLNRLKDENARIDHTQASYDRVTDCRKAEVRTIKVELAAGRLPAAAAEARLAAVRQLYQTDILIARLIGQIIVLRSEHFREAARHPAAAPQLPKKLRAQLAEQTATNQAKRGNFISSIARAEQWRDVGFVLG